MSAGAATLGVLDLPVALLNKIFTPDWDRHAALAVLPLVSKEWAAATAQPLDMFSDLRVHLPLRERGLSCLRGRTAAAKSLALTLHQSGEAGYHEGSDHSHCASAGQLSLQQAAAALSWVVAEQLNSLELNSQLQQQSLSCMHMPALMSLSHLRALRISESCLAPDLSWFSQLSSLHHLTELKFVRTSLEAWPCITKTQVSAEDTVLLWKSLSRLPLQKLHLQLYCSKQRATAAVPKELCALTYLRELVLENCGHSSLPSSFSQLTNLDTLRLADPVMCGQGFAALTELTQLDLRHARTFSLVGRPSRGGIMHGLRKLELASMGLQRLPYGIVPLQQLTHLCLAGNCLVALPVGGPWLANLECLDLSDNEFTLIPELKAPRLRLTDLRENHHLAPDRDNKIAHARAAMLGRTLLLDRSLEELLCKESWQLTPDWVFLDCAAY